MLCLQFIALLTGLAPIFPAPLALQGPVPILQPETYCSPSGSYELFVSPSQREGGGPGQHRLSRDGELLWDKQLPVTLWDAGVTDEGLVAGYAYSSGMLGRKTKGSLHLLIFDAGGEPILDEALRRKPSRAMHSYPVPRSGQLIVEGTQDLMRLRIINDTYPKTRLWRTYRLSTGERLADWAAPDRATASAIPWHARDAHAQERRELVRQLPAPTRIQLEEISEVVLAPEVVLPESPIRDVSALGFTAGGAIEFVRGHGEDCTLVTLSKAGRVVDERPLPNLQPQSGTVSWFEGQDGTWFAFVKDWDKDEFSLYRVNTRTGEPRLIEGFSHLNIESLVHTGDGGLIMLIKNAGSASSIRLIALNASGSVLWSLSEKIGSHEFEDGLFALDSLALTRDGLLVLLSTVRDSVQVFTTDGEFVQFIDLEESWGHAPRYPTRIRADERGGFCIEDDNKLWRMNVKGELLQSWKPMSSRAMPFGIRRAIFDENGMLWSAWRTSISSRKPDGSIGEHFGRLPRERAIEKPSRTWIDRKGNVHIKDRSWHIFNSLGEPLHILTPPEDFAISRDFRSHPTLGPKGGWYVPLHNRDRGSKPGHFKFSSSGQPLGQVQLGGSSMQFRGRAPGYWWESNFGRELTLVVSEVAQRQLTRRPDGAWFRNIDDFHISADGTRLAVLDSPRSLSGEDGIALAVYDGNGKSLFSLILPNTIKASCVATNGRVAAVTNFGTEILLVDLETRGVTQVEPPHPKNKGSSWRWGFSPDGHELWGVEIQALRLHRFALPAE